MKTLTDISQLKRITDQSEIRAAFARIIIAFRLANLEKEIDQIDELIGHILIHDARSATVMADHYGELIMGSAYDLDDLATQTGNIQKYLDAGSNEGYPEKEKLWRIFIELKKNNYSKSATLTKLVASIVDLNDQDENALQRQLEHYSDATNWMNPVTQQGRELEKAVKLLRQFYPEALRT